MSESHYLRWKGQRLGPYTASKIEALLAEGKISVLHEVLVDGGTVSVRDFIKKTTQNSAAQQEAEELQMVREAAAQSQRELESLRQKQAREAQAREARAQRVQAIPEPVRPVSNASGENVNPRVSGFAVASFVLGFLGLFAGIYLLCILSILAIIFGHVGQYHTNIKNHLTGKGLAITGYIFGYLGLVGWICLFILYANQ